MKQKSKEIYNKGGDEIINTNSTIEGGGILVFIAFIVFLILFTIFFISMLFAPRTTLETCISKCPDDEYGDFTDLECPKLCYDYLLNCSKVEDE